MASAAGLLDAQWEIPSVDYDGLLKLTRFVTRNQEDVERMFQRMAFNVFAHNRDDHAKQHAFLMNAAGEWTLAPPYDLTFSRGPGGEHYLAVAGRAGDDITRALLTTLASRHGIPRVRADAMLERVSDAVSCFASFACDFDVSAQTASEVGTVLQRDLLRLGAAASAPSG